jgi:hypothetical protein
MPRTRIQRIVDSSKDNPLGLNAESPLSSEKAFDSATIQRFRKLPNSSLLVDLDTGIVYVDPQTLKVLQ